jgi:hypothetical protein
MVALAEHPFASEEGVSQLEHWLTSGDREETSYAVSAYAALPFLSASARERLLDLANRHSDAGVRIEAAWACAKSGIGGGAGSLVEFARDPRHSKRAISYLEEVGLAGQIPLRKLTFRQGEQFSQGAIRGSAVRRRCR